MVRTVNTDVVVLAITYFDQTSAFAGRGKSTAWSTWMTYNEVTAAFILSDVTGHVIE